MSVYTELLNKGFSEDAAREIADAVRRVHGNDLVTKRDLAEFVTKHDLAQFELVMKRDLAQFELVVKRDLAEFEARLAWKIGAMNAGSMVALTGIFAIIVGWIMR